MQHLTWYRLLAVGVLATPITGRAQAPKPQVPPATVRELATIEGDVSGFVRLPSGRALIYSIDDSTFAYQIGTKQRTLLGTDMRPASVSPQGDLLAFGRSSEDRTGVFLWTMPIDPKTGTARGPAHRVSLRPTDRGRARFSPDGKLLAFSAGPRPDGTWDIALVPATGGAERVVANYLRMVAAFDWSADGKALHVELNSGSTQDYQTAIERVLVGGGSAEPLFPATLLTVHWVVGLSPDARVAVFQNNPDRFFYRTASGVEGEIPVALPPLDDGWGVDFSLESMRYTTMTQIHNSTVRILDLATGQARDLLPGRVATSAPAWSPDGRRLAVLIGNYSHYEIAILNADGSGLRRYPLPKELNGWGQPWGLPSGKPWSPDGRFLAFRARDRGEVGGNDTERLLLLLDVNSGQTRVLTRASSAIVSFVWRSDGTAIRTLKATEGPMGSPNRWTVVETPLKGPERQLRDISADFPTPYNIVFISDREVAFAVARDKQVWFVMPLEGGGARRLPDPGGEPSPGERVAATPELGNHLSIRMKESPGQGPVFKWVSTVGDSTRTVQLPVGSINGAALPDGKHVIVIVADNPANKSTNRIFLMPLDGGARRLLTEGPRGGGHQLVPSPDGKLLAYTADGRYTSSLFEIDFSPPLRALMKP